MATRAPKSSGTESTPAPSIGLPSPTIPVGIQDHSFHTQAVFNIHGQVAKLEIGLQNVEKRLEGVEEKLDNVRLDVHGAKKVAIIFGSIISAIGAIGLLLLNKVADVVVNHYKH